MAKSGDTPGIGFDKALTVFSMLSATMLSFDGSFGGVLYRYHHDDCSQIQPVLFLSKERVDGPRMV